ncbi:MAG: ABC transporter ATP-binding protein [Gammaproteobacteria bacterium]|nr:ABC transporter ATP-binding protein [Gammaproteobacteria bacterium]
MIELQSVDRIFEVGDEHVHALDKVDLSIEAGEYLSIMGPSGSGKSTLLNLLGLLDRPTAGRYLLDGRDTTEFDDAEQAHTRGEKIGFVFQAFHLIPRLSAAENVELPMILAGIAPSKRHERVAHALDSMDLSDRTEHRPDQLSGGQRQRVAIARATVMGPAVLMADEPTGNLDTRSGEEVVEVLEQLNEQGLTLLVVTHDPDLGKRARRRLHMVDGRIVEDIVSEPVMS